MTVLKWGDHVVATGLIVGHTVPVTKGTRGVVVHAQGARVWVVPEDRHNASSYSAVLWERDRGAPLAADTTAGWQAYWDGVALERANTEPVRDRAPDREGRMNANPGNYSSQGFDWPTSSDDEPVDSAARYWHHEAVELRAEVDRWRAEAEHRQEALTAVLAVVEAMRATLAEAEDAQATDAEWARQARTALWFVRQEEVVAFVARVSVLEAELRERKANDESSSREDEQP